VRRIRVIPILLLDGLKLIKTAKFSEPVYIGDPRNAVKIFNEKEVDELLLLDISATIKKKSPNFTLIKEIASECFMPIGYGGGIHSLKDVEQLFGCGVEKIILNSEAVANPNIIKDLSLRYGSQAIVVSIDVKKNFFGKYSIYIHNGKTNTKLNPIEFVRKCEDLGAGEICLTSIDHEGTMQGYDLLLTKSISKSTNLPVIASGGAGSIKDFVNVVTDGYASAVSAGSMFVFHGKLRGILINYPSQATLQTELFDKI